MLYNVMLVVPSCLDVGWKETEAVPVAVDWAAGTPKGEVAGAPNVDAEDAMM